MPQPFFYMTHSHRAISRLRRLQLSLVVTISAAVLLQTTGVALIAAGQDHIVSETKLFSIVAIASQDGVVVRWSTNFERNNVGFNIYRTRNQLRLRVNEEIIPGSLFIAGDNVPLLAGRAYSWFDQSGTLDSRYSIEAIGSDGIVTSSADVLPKQFDENFFQKQFSDFTNLPSNRFPIPQQEYPAAGGQPVRTKGQIEDQWTIASQAGLKIAIKKDGWYRITQQEMAAAGFNPAVDIANLRLFNFSRELAILTNRSSGQFVSDDYIEFYGQGLDTPTTGTNIYYLIAGAVAGKRIQTASKKVRDQVRPETVSPSSPGAGLRGARGVSVSMWFPWLPGALNTCPRCGATTNDSSAPAIPDIATREHPAKTLPEAAPQVPPPMNKLSAAPASKRQKRKRKQKEPLKAIYAHAHATTTSIQANAGGFDYTVERKERRVYFVSLLNGDAENFFGQVISGAPITQTLTVTNLETTASTTAQLEIALQGANAINHVFTVQLNNVTVDTFSFSGITHKVETISIPLSQLVSGNNSIKLIPAAGSGVSIVDYIRLTYPHSYTADSGALRFPQAGSQVVRVDGFATPAIRLIDYTDPFDVKAIKPLVELNGAAYTIQIPAAAGSSSRLLYALPEAGADQPASVSLNLPSSLNLSTNGADYLIIAPHDLIPSVMPLANLRTSQGMTVSVIDVEDVYDEFSYGSHGPQAIKDFLALASTRWTKAPRYVLLAGDASYDPRDYLGYGNRDFVPTKLVDATFNETASDDWLSDFDNDGIANIPVGRLPIGSVSQANLVISKIVNFTPANVPQSALLIADTQGTYYFNFEQANTQVQSILPASMTVFRVDRRTEPSDAQASANIISKLNSGQALLNYSGHGNVNTWTNASIFTSANALALTNGNKLPLVVVMDCLNGYFQEPNPDPAAYGLAEAFMLAPAGGAVGAFSSSGLTIPDGQHAMSLQLYAILYGSQPIAVGDAIKAAKLATTDIDVRRTWIYFGDPSLKIR